ncbi:PQQ-binding-like beta-propeller repeat protein [Actinoplanes sp. NPDC049118]|uniref:outer membrane protein assembly factor BamB family protein n=1 Tax=Actinoplanes sp. NPDC049118 TaxID=3155769 RepID=UPI0034117FCA
MAGAVPLIDLDAAPRAPAEAGSPRPLAAVPRPILLLGVLVAALLTLAAAAAPPRTMRPVLAAGGTAAAAFTLGPDALYTATFGQNPNSESGVRRFALPGGEQLWATPLSQNVQNLMLDGGILLARSGAEPRVSFLDADDGSVLWRLNSPNTSVVTLSGGRVLLRADTEDGGTELRLASARTGATIWSRAIERESEVRNDDLFEDDPDRIVLVGVDGHVTTLSFADGSVLGEGDLGVRLPTELDDDFLTDFADITVAGDRLYLSRGDDGRVSLTAFGLPQLTERWRTVGGPAGYVNDCGPVLCVSDTARVSGLDPGDGAVRWSEPAWSNASPLGDGTLLAYDRQEDPVSVILDARTGAVLRRLGHTHVTGGLELRADTEILGRTWVNVADPAAGDGAVHTVGALDTAAPYGCTVLAPYLACPTSAGPTTVWRIP